jgi:hypothetical protein
MIPPTKTTTDQVKATLGSSSFWALIAGITLLVLILAIAAYNTMPDLTGTSGSPTFEAAAPTPRSP